MYNVGDEVVIMEDLRVGVYGTNDVTYSMLSYAGKIMEVQDVLYYSDNRQEYILMGSFHNWTNEMIDHERTMVLNNVEQITWDEIKNRLCEEELVINCSTKEDAVDLLFKLNVLGYRWFAGDKLLHETRYDEYDHKTCYRVRKDKAVNFKDLCFYEVEGHKVYRYRKNTPNKEIPYKTWEMIKELSKYPHKKFKRESDGLEMEVNSKGELRWEPGYDYMKPNQTWLEHKLQPVSFDEAAKAHQNNCDIICVESGIKNIYRTNIIGRLVNESGTPVTTAEILSGTWYIEGKISLE